MRQIIGGLLVASPIIGIFVFMWRDSGLGEAIKAFLLTAAICAIVFTGCFLLGG